MESCPGSSKTAQPPQLITDGAVYFLHQVKQEFADRPDVFKEFLGIMKQLQSEAIDTPAAMRLVSTLFHDHPDLLVGFNTFLPPNQHIQPNPLARSTSAHAQTPAADSMSAHPTTNQGHVYLEQVKQAFADQPDRFKQFIALVKEFQAERIDTRDTLRRVAALFAGHPRLLDGFRAFLPPGYPLPPDIAALYQVKPPLAKQS